MVLAVASNVALNICNIKFHVNMVRLSPHVHVLSMAMVWSPEYTIYSKTYMNFQQTMATAAGSNLIEELILTWYSTLKAVFLTLRKTTSVLNGGHACWICGSLHIQSLENSFTLQWKHYLLYGYIECSKLRGCSADGANYSAKGVFCDWEGLQDLKRQKRTAAPRLFDAWGWHGFQCKYRSNGSWSSLWLFCSLWF